MIIKKPKFWDYKRPNIFSILLLPFTIPIRINNFYNRIKKDRNKNYKVENKHNLKTICVGNIYIGGTGKTPSAIKISQILNNLNFKTVFIKKNYIKSLDEYKLLEKYGSVLSDTQRIMSLNKASRNFDVGIFDDGLQDSSINYDLKFVCFNSETFIGNGMLIPSGPLREKINSLKKYDAVFLNGHNENIDNIVLKIKKYNGNIKIFKSIYTLTNIKQLNKKNRYLAFAGIGIPLNFYKTLVNHGIEVVKLLEYPDHHTYNNKEINKILNIAKDLNAQIITTEKDYTRIEISNDNSLLKNIQPIKMELKIKNVDELITLLKNTI
jgi:tetraacyldisaccharide 4'-kinase